MQKIEVRDKGGHVVDSWTSGTKPHELKLTEGEYELKEVVAPEGFNRVTTTIKFKVDSEGKVTLLTADVDNGGKISVLDTDHIVLEDAPTPTVSKKVNKEDNYSIKSRDEEFTYVITATLAYVPKEKFVVEDDIPDVIELVNEDDISIIVNGKELTVDERDQILTIAGNKLTVAPTIEMIEEWAPLNMKLQFKCKFREGADLSKYPKGVKNIAIVLVDGIEILPSDGENEATVLGIYDSPTKSTDTGDNTAIYAWITLMTASLIALSLMALWRRRRA